MVQPIQDVPSARKKEEKILKGYFRSMFAYAALSWSQFLVALTVIEKSDRMRWDEIGANLDSHLAFNKWDMHVFGTVSLTFNILSIVLLSIGGLQKYENQSFKYSETEKLPDWLERYSSAIYLPRDVGRYINFIDSTGRACWAVSFLSLLIYIDQFYAILAVVAMSLLLCSFLAWTFLVLFVRSVGYLVDLLDKRS